MDSKKPIQDMTVEEIFRQQLELLAEASLRVIEASDLSRLTDAMVLVADNVRPLNKLS